VYRGVFFDLDDTLFDRSAAMFRMAAGALAGSDAFAHQLATQVEPEPGVRKLVVDLARDRRIAVVTNGGVAQREKLRRAGLADVVHAVFVSCELGIAKPASAIFERALAWSELSPSDCIFVGDDPELDMLPAAALGFATCWRVRDGRAWSADQPAPTFIARSVAELREVLA
jgi:putative hydrolase of the HAD superfamily